MDDDVDLDADGPEELEGPEAPRRGPTGSVGYSIKLSDRAFEEGLSAIHVQSLRFRRVQSLRRAAVFGLRAFLELDRQGIIDLLTAREPGWHRGENIFYLQLTRDEHELLRDVRKAVNWVLPTRIPETMAETIALGLAAGADRALVWKVAEETENPRRKMRRRIP